jgi:hypothetical protein
MSGPTLAATVCRTLSGEYEPLAKRVTLNGEGGYAVQGYSRATWFTLATFACPDIVTFGRKLFALAKDPAAAVLRGAPLPHVRLGKCYYRRFKHADPNTNSLEEMPRSWIAVDDAPAPPALPNWLNDVPAAARHLVQLLPEELHDVTCVVQVTGSASLTGDGLLRLRLWFGLDREIGCAAVKRWAKAWNHARRTKVIDWSIYTPVALNYTADPLLGAGVMSPVAKRWYLLEGRQDRATLVLPPEPVEPIREPSLATAVVVDAVNGSVSTRRRSFSDLVGLIGSTEFGFYEPIKSALGRGAADGQDREATVTAVRAAVLAADPGHRDPPTIGRYADRGFLSTAFNSFSRQDAQQRRVNEQIHRHWFARSATSRTGDPMDRAGASR